MNIFKRAFLSVKRRPIRNSILLIVIYCIAALITIGISAGYTSSEAQLAAKNQVGAYFELQLDYDNFYDRLNQLMEEEGKDLSWTPPPPASPIEFHSPLTYQFMSLLRDDIHALEKIEGVMDYNIEAFIQEMKAINFERIEGPFPNEKEIPEVALRGIRDLSLLNIVQDGSITLKEGRFIQPDDVDKIVISEELAQLNDLQIGSTLIFETQPMKDPGMAAVRERYGIEDGKMVQIEGEIVGIFQNNRSITLTPGEVSRSSENTIFTNLAFVEVGVYEDDPYYYLATFHIENVEDFDKIKTQLEKVDIDWDRYNLIDQNNVIEELSPVFSQLKKSGQMLLVVTMIAAFGILFLVFTFLIKGRTHEIGIWLSLGNAKKKIVFQILWEALLVTGIALILCISTSSLIAQGAQSYFDNQTMSQPIVEEDVSLDQMYISEDLEKPERVNLVIQASTILMMIGAIATLITVSIMMAAIPILRLNPREIFSKLS